MLFLIERLVALSLHKTEVPHALPSVGVAKLQHAHIPVVIGMRIQHLVADIISRGVLRPRHQDLLTRTDTQGALRGVHGGQQLEHLIDGLIIVDGLAHQFGVRRAQETALRLVVAGDSDQAGTRFTQRNGFDGFVDVIGIRTLGGTFQMSLQIMQMPIEGRGIREYADGILEDAEPVLD